SQTRPLSHLWIHSDRRQRPHLEGSWLSFPVSHRTPTRYANARQRRRDRGPCAPVDESPARGGQAEPLDWTGKERESATADHRTLSAGEPCAGNLSLRSGLHLRPAYKLRRHLEPDLCCISRNSGGTTLRPGGGRQPGS